MLPMNLFPRGLFGVGEAHRLHVGEGLSRESQRLFIIAAFSFEDSLIALPNIDEKAVT